LMLKTNADRIDTGLDPLIISTNTTYLQILANLGCNDSRPDTACANGIGPQSGGNGEPGAWWKFLIAHELGHAFNGPGIFVNGRSSDDTLSYCRCDHVINGPEHCLQQSHASVYATGEAYAHFFSAKIWNNDSQGNGKFVYYKKFKNVDGSITYPPFGYEAFNPVKWMENHCSGGPNWTGLGTEWDWLTFLYNVSSRDRTDRTMSTDMVGIMQLACWDYPGCDGAKWSLPPGPNDQYNWSIVDSAAYWYGGSYQDPRYARFHLTGTSQGIAHN
jgi:hypothetical protein